MNNLQLLKAAHTAVFEKTGIETTASIASFFSENYVAHAGDKTYKGIDFIVQYTAQLHTAIPDIRLMIIEPLAQTETMVTYQRKFSGTHKKKLKGIPASGKKITWHEMVVTRFENNKIIEEWVLSDLAMQLMVKRRK